MEDISTSLENAGYTTYLPQRDGLETMLDFMSKSAGLFPDISIFRYLKNHFNEYVFAMDFYQIQLCDSMVMNLNGRVPDEGAIVESSTAFTTGKPLIFYKNDMRAPFYGEDNSMILGLTYPIISRTVKEIENIPKELKKVEDFFEKKNKGYEYTINMPFNVKEIMRIGKIVSEITERIISSTSRLEKIKLFIEMYNQTKSLMESKEEQTNF